MSLQADLNVSVGEGEVDGISRGDLRDDFFCLVSSSHPGPRVAEVMPNLTNQREIPVNPSLTPTYREILETKVIYRRSIILR